jgi:hypothetical protein
MGLYPHWEKFKHVIKAMADGKAIILNDSLNNIPYTKDTIYSGFSFCYSPEDYIIVGDSKTIKLKTLRTR